MGEEDDRKDHKNNGKPIANPERTGHGQRGAQRGGAFTPEGTAVDMALFRNVYLGVVAGRNLKFPSLLGSDLNGEAWSGSYSILSDGPRIFEGRKVTRSREVVTLKVAENGIPVISISTKYFTADGGIYKIVFNSGASYLPVFQSILPTCIRVGDIGTLGILEGSDATTVTVTWALKPGMKGSSILELSSVVTGVGVSAKETDSYLLDPTGIPRTVTLSASTMGTTVTLTGKKRSDL